MGKKLPSPAPSQWERCRNQRWWRHGGRHSFAPPKQRLPAVRLGIIAPTDDTDSTRRTTGPVMGFHKWASAFKIPPVEPLSCARASLVVDAKSSPVFSVRQRKANNVFSWRTQPTTFRFRIPSAADARALAGCLKRMDAAEETHSTACEVWDLPVVIIYPTCRRPSTEVATESLTLGDLKEQGDSPIGKWHE